MTQHKNTYLLIAIAIYGIIIVACGKTADSANTAVQEKKVVESLKPTNASRMVKFLSSDPKAYINFYAATDYEFGLISSRTNPLTKPSSYAFSRKGRTTEDPGLGVPVNQSLQINGIETNEALKTKSNSNEPLADFFGKKMVFRIGSQTKSGAFDENELYIPEIVSITSPRITDASELHPRCDINNFVIRWNADPLNENGVIIKIAWGGTVLFGHHLDGSQVILADLFPDTGEATLPLQMFEGIPDTALCELTIMRGNVDAIMVDDYSYKMGGASSETMSFILLRYIRHK